ncbi:MFS transporter [Desulfohalovibrio reitneri]|uniref:MFS transporter n=1 Tax=Desulfohalovibrio reitneri TaxID=1307759 RepID=UPI0004A6B624|nr:MFS transporter [Desulfohalovibrio reitneri]
MTKWIVLAAGVAIQMILGGVYAWSEFVPVLTDEYGLSRSQCGMIFGATIAMFTLTMIPAGRVLQKYGPRVTASIGAVLFASGYLLASFSQGEFVMLLVCLSGIAGAGIGFGYICPLTVGMKWFPDNKGLVTGVAVAGFGGGAVLLSTIAQHLLADVGLDVMRVFFFIGLGSGVIALTGAMLMRLPQGETSAANVDTPEPAAGSVFKSRNFALIFLGMFCGTFAGLLVVGNLKPLALSLGLSAASATLSISLFAMGNAAGRILWGQIHDRIGSRQAITFSLCFLGLCLLPLLTGAPGTMVLATVFLVGMGFGACFVVYASSVVELFGTRLFPKLYPVCFLGYGLAALVGPPVGGWIADTTGSYIPAVILSAAIVLGMAPVAWAMFRRPAAYACE